MERTAMERRAAEIRIAQLEMKVALLEIEAGVGDHLKTFFINYIQSPVVSIASLPKKLWTELYKKGKPLDDIFEIAIKHLAPEITKKVREAQIELHVEEFKAGFEARETELALGGGYAEFVLDDDHSDDWIAGYKYREEKGGVWTSDLQKEVVEIGLREWSDLIEVSVVKTTLIDIFQAVNPIELLKSIWKSVKKYGIKVAIPIVIMEILITTVPLWATKLVGPKAALIMSQIPVTELLTPAYLKWLGSGSADEDVDGYLDWYEKEFGSVKLAGHTRSSRIPF